MRTAFQGDGGNTWHVDVAAGTTTGTDHIRSGKLLIGKGNQDAYKVAASRHCVVGVICDGCGSGPHSEVGSNLAANLIADSVLRHFERFELTPQLLRQVEMDVLSRIDDLASHFPGSYSQNINDYFLFTTVLAIIDHRGNVYADMIGDGCMLTPSMTTLYKPSYPNNEPPYLAYNLVKSAINPDLLHFRAPPDWLFERCCNSFPFPTAQHISPCPFIIGSDGAEKLEEIGQSLEQFYEDKYFENDQAVTRRLLTLNSEIVKIEDGRISRQIGKLNDDTTLIAFRRQY